MREDPTRRGTSLFKWPAPGNPATWQIGLESAIPSVGDCRVPNRKQLKPGEVLEVDQSSIRDSRSAQRKAFESSQLADFSQAAVRDLRPVQVQDLQIWTGSQVSKPIV